MIDTPEDKQYEGMFRKHGVNINDYDINELKKKRKKYDKAKKANHVVIVRQFLTAIDVCPMPEELKQLLRLRFWGTNAEVFCPLTCEQIGIMTKTSVKLVESFEEEAKGRLKEYFDKYHVSEIEMDFVRQKHGNKGMMFDKNGKPLTDQKL